MIQNVILPKQGLQMTEGFITRWLRKEGDPVKEGEPLFEMETDKLVITIDASCSGKLLKILYPEGSTVPITTVIAYVGEEGDALPEERPEAPAAPATPAEPQAVPAPQPVPAPAEIPEPAGKPLSAAPGSAGRIFATPRARTAAAEKGFDLREIAPTGPDGLIIERDVLSFAPAALPAGNTAPQAAAYLLSARVSLFEDASIAPETILRLAYWKAAQQTGLACGEEPVVRVLDNSAITFCRMPSAEAQITCSGGHLTLSFYPEEAEDETVLEFFRLLCLFAEKPWLAAVK